eukprot:s448_g17.t1
MPVVSVNGRDKQDRRVHNAEDMAEDSQVPASPTPAAGGPDTSATMIHPGGVGTAAGFKKRVRAHQRLNGMWEALSNQRFSQLERFLFVLSRADSRLAAIPESTLRSRVCFLSCSSSETMTIDSATRQVWFRQLAPVLQNVDPFETRVLQLEDFVERHGRLPSLDKSLPQEYRLAIFLKNTGYYIRQGGMAAMQRYQRLLASPSSSVRLRVLRWQDPEKRFRTQCDELQDHMRQFHSLPSQNAESDSSRHLANFLDYQRNLIRKDPRRYETRKQALRATHPLVAKYIEKPYKPYAGQQALFAQNLLKLQQFIDQTGKLPSPHKDTPSSKEHRLYVWMLFQRQRLTLMPKAKRSRLFNLHPLVASFMRQKLQTRGSKLSAP